MFDKTIIKDLELYPDSIEVYTVKKINTGIMLKVLKTKGK